jgi:hypothetical protein
VFPCLLQLIAGTSKFAGLLDKKALLTAHLIMRRPLAAHLIRRRPLAAHLIKRPPLAAHLMKQPPLVASLAMLAPLEAHLIKPPLLAAHLMKRPSLANQRMYETLLRRSRGSREKRQAREPKEDGSIRGNTFKGIGSRDRCFYLKVHNIQ